MENIPGEAWVLTDFNVHNEVAVLLNSREDIIPKPQQQGQKDLGIISGAGEIVAHLTPVIQGIIKAISRGTTAFTGTAIQDGAIPLIEVVQAKGIAPTGVKERNYVMLSMGWIKRMRHVHAMIVHSLTSAGNVMVLIHVSIVRKVRVAVSKYA